MSGLVCVGWGGWGLGPWPRLEGLRGGAHPVALTYGPSASALRWCSSPMGRPPPAKRRRLPALPSPLR